MHSPAADDDEYSWQGVQCHQRGGARAPPRSYSEDDDEDEYDDDDDASYEGERVGNRLPPSQQSTLFEDDAADAASRCCAAVEPAQLFEDAVRDASQRLKRSRQEENDECDREDQRDLADRAGCWGCKYGASRHDGESANAQVNALVRLIRDNHGRMANIELARIVHLHHENEIRQPALSAGDPCSEWPVRAVLAHLRHHTLDPSIVQAESIRALRGIMRMLKRRTMETDLDTGTERVDARNVELLLKTVKGISDLYARKSEGLLFGSACAEYVVADKSAARK
jgi:hypothetical protein